MQLKPFLFWTISIVIRKTILDQIYSLWFKKVKKQPVNRLLSSKLDGIRCTIFDGVAYSRSLKPIPNKYIQSEIYGYRKLLEGVDCEIIIGEPNVSDVFSTTTSGVMSFDKKSQFTLCCFDICDEKNTYRKRHEKLIDRVHSIEFAALLPQFKVYSQEDVDRLEANEIEAGFEGVMLRDADSLYRCGRSGTINPELQKVKRFVDSEFEIVGYEPKYHNANEATTNELGRTVRSSAKEGLIPLEELGVLILRVPGTKDKTFGCGSGFSANDRIRLWKIREDLLSEYATIKYFEVGMQDSVPRFPIFKGIIWKDDM